MGGPLQHTQTHSCHETPRPPRPSVPPEDGHLLSVELAVAVFAVHGDGRSDGSQQHDGADNPPDDAARGRPFLWKTSACRKRGERGETRPAAQTSTITTNRQERWWRREIG